MEQVQRISEKALMNWRWHIGDALGFPATGNQVVLPGSSFLTCQDGKMMDGRNYMDLTKMTQQLQSVQSI
jgi:predicted ester cyclase